MSESRKQTTAWSSAFLLAGFALVGCAAPAKNKQISTEAGSRATATSTKAAGSHAEAVAEIIALDGPTRSRESEISGLTWYNDHLILLPQYPNRFDSHHDGALFAISRDELRRVVNSEVKQPVAPRSIELVAPGLWQQIPDAQGVEAIGFWGDRVFLTIEAGYGDHMTGYLVAGQISPDLSRIILDAQLLAKIPARAAVVNASEEALIVTRSRVITIYEANGVNINPSPVAHVFDHDLNPLGTIPFPHIEYRIIDATSLDRQNRFWVTNYFYTGDRDAYRPASDPITAAHGEGETHASSDTVERLLLLEYTGSRIELVDQAPIQLRLGSQGRNWEGLARWQGEGFMLITDMFPDTMFAFLPAPGLEGH
ncbi:MAG: hypothetical protein MJE77_04550 [Proteobacteria bacterium]|nr:hypothetical protein [Pseudomonadota bacterium]